MKVIKDIKYNNYDACLLDVNLADDNKATFVYFHGGGLDSGSKDDMKFPTYLVERGINVINVNYRMYPEYKYPDFIVDGAVATKWAIDNAKKYGYSDNIYVGGSSAGSYITMMLVYCEQYYKDAGVDVDSIKGFVLDAGQPTAHFNVLKQSGVDGRRVIVDERAPLYYIGTRESYPPCMYIVSDHDMTNRYEQTMLMLSTLKHFGLDSNVTFKLMNGRHCAYINQVDDNGVYTFGKMIYDYIMSIENK